MTTLELLTCAESARILGVDRRTVQRLANAGALSPATKSPGRTGAFLFHRADVEALRDEREADA